MPDQKKSKKLPISKNKSSHKALSIEKNLNIKSEIIPVIGIGASAGGLEAIEEFFNYVPAKCGCAFVVITHLDRTHSSIMPELIQKHTNMPVVHIQEGQKVQPDSIYVIPPNVNVAIKDDVFHLIEQISPRYTSLLPVNFFFDSLAKEKKDKAVGIILSGSGSDGTLGIKSIKSEDGFVIVQDPLTAKYDGMPQSAANTGLADYILPIEKIPEKLNRYIHYGELKEGQISPEMDEIFKLLRVHTGHDFSFYKLNTIYRRIERQMHVYQVHNLVDYVKFLRVNPHAVKALFKDLLIGVTHFFRDPEAFEVLKHNVLPTILKGKLDDETIRVWIPGCSSGEEAYSVAIIICECLDELRESYNVQIFSTDIDASALDIARAGFYPATIANEVSPERLKRFFDKEKKGYRIKKEMRKMVVFGLQNIIKDPPFTRLDLICCRNLLIYFNSHLQKKLLPIFHYSLKPKGILFLGTSEIIAGFDDLFRLLDKRWKLFKRKDGDSHRGKGFDFTVIPPKFPELTFNENNHDSEKISFLESINHYLIHQYVPSCLIINNIGEIIYDHDHGEHYLGLTEKKGRNIFEIIPFKLKNKFASGIRKALSSKKNVILNDFQIESARDEYYTININIINIMDPHIPADLLFIIFNKNITPTQIKTTNEKYGSLGKMSKKIIQLEEELQYTKENLQTSIEDLQSSNEELQSTNEELQSTNEEIETSKEELQSLNEELVSVNSELQNKVDQLASIHDDMNNLFNSTEILAIFLDNELQIKRYTPKVLDLIPLIQSDIGRSISHFAVAIKYENLINDVVDVLSTLIPKSFKVESKDNKYYLVRILPYRTLSNIIDGVTIIFNDISKHDEIELKLEKFNSALDLSLTFTNNILDRITDPLLVLSEDFKVISANCAFYTFFNVNHTDIVNKSIHSINDGKWNSKLLLNQLEDMNKKDISMKQIEIEQDFPGVGNKKLNLTAYKVIQKDLETKSILLLIEVK